MPVSGCWIVKGVILVLFLLRTEPSTGIKHPASSILPTNAYSDTNIRKSVQETRYRLCFGLPLRAWHIERVQKHL